MKTDIRNRIRTSTRLEIEAERNSEMPNCSIWFPGTSRDRTQLDSSRLQYESRNVARSSLPARNSDKKLSSSVLLIVLKEAKSLTQNSTLEMKPTETQILMLKRVPYAWTFPGSQNAPLHRFLMFSFTSINHIGWRYFEQMVENSLKLSKALQE